MRISQLAGSAGVPVSTVRYYERVGLLGLPERTASGYRDYGVDAAARLLFITRARRMGLSCDQIVDLLPVWAGADCGAAHDRVVDLIQEKQGEIAQRVADLQELSAQLDVVRATLEEQAPPVTCRSDLSCCVPETAREPVLVELGFRGP